MLCFGFLVIHFQCNCTVVGVSSFDDSGSLNFMTTVCSLKYSLSGLLFNV
jgi:hypothetical protein